MTTADTGRLWTDKETEGKGLLLGDCKQTRLGIETAKPEDREEEKEVHKETNWNKKGET